MPVTAQTCLDIPKAVPVASRPVVHDVRAAMGMREAPKSTCCDGLKIDIGTTVSSLLKKQKHLLRFGLVFINHILKLEKWKSEKKI